MRHILITGANRGIGLALVRLYRQQNDTVVFATCRQPEAAADLSALAAQAAGRVHVVALDVVDQGSIDRSLAAVKAHTDRLEMLVNNAGTYAGRVGDADPRVSRFGLLQPQPMLDLFRVNTVAPMMVAQAYAGLLRKSTNARLVNISSDAGSLSRADNGGSYSYPASKTALNMLTRCLASDFRADAVIVVSIHPGFIRTDMGGPDAPLAPEETIPTMVRVIDGLTMADSGQFFNWDGASVPW